LIFNPERVSAFTTLDTLDPRPDALQRNWGGMVTPFVKSPVEAITNYSTFKGRSYSENERVWSPWLVQRAQALGVPVPGYGPKKDTYANEFGAGYSPRLDTLLRMLPIFGQQASVIPSREGGTHLAALKYSTGLPLSPYDRLRGAYYADKAGR